MCSMVTRGGMSNTDYYHQFKAYAIWAALGYSVAAMVLITTLFSWLRPHNSVVYAPKTKYADDKHAPPAIGNGLFAWFGPVARMKEAALVEKVGLDGAVFLRFTRMCRNIFLFTSAVGILVLLPANVKGSMKFSGASGDQFFTSMTPQLVSGKALWAHVVSAYLIDAIIAFFLWRNYIGVTRLRRNYFESADYLQSLHSRTLMMIDLPPAARSDEGIMEIADGVEQTSGVPRAAIGRNVKELPDLIDEHEDAVRELESVLSKYLKNPEKLPASRPTIRPSKKYRKSNGGDKVDAIDYLTDRIRELETEIEFVREGVDKRNPMPYGFASYEKIEEAHTVAYAARNKHPQGATIILAPKPNDLIWPNLPLSPKSKRWKRFMNNFWIALLTVVWIAPNALIAVFLSNLQNLAAVWHGFQNNFIAHHKTWSIVQGIASPALTSLIYLILPIIFRRLSTRGGDTTKTSRERHVASKLYAFFIFNNLIVFSIFGVIWGFVASVMAIKKTNQNIWDAIKEAKFFVNLLNGLCLISPFWLTWMIQRNLGAAADLAQVITLVWTWFARTFMSPTPRQTIEWTAPQYFDYAVYHNYFLFYATVALCFATLQPLVLPVTFLYFAIDYWLKKYLLLYIFITKNESGGQYWRLLFDRFVFATILANVFMALVLMARGTWNMLIVMIPLPLLLIGFKIYCARTFDAQMTYYTKATLKDPSTLAEAGQKARRGHEKVASRFGHPALHKKLMTPMVHAKAQQALSQLYRGRLGGQSDGPTVSGHSDIALCQMSQQHPGKSARFASDKDQKKKNMFEVVPETQLDFGYFMNRAEFRETHGGDGELYGRPEDLISERSGTPRSFLSRGASDDASSRASSPDRGYSPSGRAYSPAGPRLQQTTYRDVSEGELGTGQQGAFYGRGGNESESQLLSGAQPLGQGGRRGEEAGHEKYGLNRWRTGGSGYAGVPGQDLGNEGMGYEAFRRGR